MRTTLRWLIPGLVGVALVSLGWRFTIRLQHKQAVAEGVKTLPSFGVRTTTGDTLTSAMLAQRPCVLVYIDPDCGHCQRQIEQIANAGDALNRADIVLLSAAPLSALNEFAKTHKLTNLAHVRVAHIEAKQAWETFGFATTPDLLIYRANGQLAKHFKGEASAEAIARHL